MEAMCWSANYFTHFIKYSPSYNSLGFLSLSHTPRTHQYLPLKYVSFKFTQIKCYRYFIKLLEHNIYI
jgi:hypothetical protein